MALSAFDDGTRQPTPDELAAVLGTAAAAWATLVRHIGERYPPITELWSFAGAKWGWSLRLKRKDRVILYLTPQAGQFQLGVVLGEKAVAAARASGLPEPVLALIDGAPRYAEGRGIRFAVTDEPGVQVGAQLAAIKMGS
jgi:hypothetical protein